MAAQKDSRAPGGAWFRSETGLIDRLQATRIHTMLGSPEVLAVALALPQRWLRGLPAPLLRAWLDEERGHIVLSPGHHGFSAGACAYRNRTLLDVAWLEPGLYALDHVAFLTPCGQLVASLLGWNDEEAGLLRAWDDFVAGVQSCFRGGYGRSPEARADPSVYLAEGIAAYLVDRRALNATDPRLEKLLAALLFEPSMYR